MTDEFKAIVGSIVEAEAAKYQNPGYDPLEAILTRIRGFDYTYEASDSKHERLRAEGEAQCIAAEAVELPWHMFGDLLSAAQRDDNKFVVLGSRTLQIAILEHALRIVREQRIQAHREDK